MKDLRQFGKGASISRRQRVRLSGGGVPVMDMVDGNGRGVVACPVPVAGGTSDSFAYFPPAEGTDTPVVTSEGAFSQMLPTSAVSWPSKLNADAAFVEEAPYVEDTEDYPDQATVGDVVIKHAGTRVQITSEGNLILSSEKPIRVQMPYRSYMRVSIEGSDTLEHLLLAGPTVDAINALATKIDDLNTRMMSVFAALAAEVPSSIAAGLVATKGVISNLTTTVPYTSAPQAVVEDVSSAAFMVSSQTVTDTQSTGL